MTRLRLAVAIAATCGMSFIGAVSAEPAPEGPVGPGCEYAPVTAASDGTTEAARLTAGPLTGDGTIRCTIQVGAGTHGGPDAATAESGGSAVVVLPPTLVSYDRPGNAQLFVCSQWVHSDGTVMYRVADGTGSWSANPSHKCDTVPVTAEDLFNVVPRDPSPEPAGTLCGATAAGVGSAENGAVEGGPLTIVARDGRPLTGALTCAVQVGTASHAGADVCVSSSPAGTVAVAPAIACGWAARATDRVYVCTKVTINGWGTLYYDDFDNVWSASSGARCQLARTIAGPDDGATAKDDHSPRVRKAKKPKHGDPPGASVVPHYPTGIIEMKRLPNGQVEVAFRDFVPPIGEWDCPVSPTSVTCTPPAAPDGMTTVCGALTVEVTNTAVGTVTGNSKCASGPGATASSSGPATAPSVAAAVANTSFAWTCAVNPGVSPVWSARCAVGG